MNRARPELTILCLEGKGGNGRLPNWKPREKKRTVVAWWGLGRPAMGPRTSPPFALS
jgi:hypothetical protein